jgi:ABC-2 type transport system permease protein
MNARRVAAVLAKETREILRDPITLGVALAMPLVMLLLFGYAVSLDVRSAPLGVLDLDHSPASRRLADRFAATEYFERAATFADLRGVEDGLRRGEVKLALVIPQHFARATARGEAAAVQVLVDGTYASTARLVSSYATAIVAASSPAPEPIRLETRVWYNPELRSVNHVVPGLFGVILMAFPPLLTALAIVREKETGSIQQVFASPLSGAEYLTGKLIPYGLIAFLQLLLVMAVGFAWFAVPLRGSLAFLVGAGLVYVFCTVGIGLLVSTITRSQLAAMLLALIVTLMPSFLFSGFLFPIFAMPYSTQLYSAIFPARYFVEFSRGVVLKGAGPAELWPNLALLAAYTLAVFALAAWRFRKKVA